MAASIVEALKMIPSTSTLLTLYASFSTTSMLLRNAYNEIIPERLESFIVDKFKSFFCSPEPSAELDTFIIDDDWVDLDRNDLLFAARVYLSTKIGPRNKRIRVGKFKHQKQVSTALAEGETVVDEFDGVKITWKLAPDDDDDDNSNCDGMNYFEIQFEKKHREKVLEGYFSHVLDIYKKLSHKEESLKLYTRPQSSWRGMDLKHPTTFETLAMDLDFKKKIINDLDRFVARKDFYKRIGKAWKRGYLLYGPPGTGKSSLVAAMANYLRFDIYALELCEISSDYELRMALMAIDNKSITVVEDIDCHSEVRTRSSKDKDDDDSSDDDDRRRSPRFTLSTLLNCIDGLWSSGVEERIVVFTTNHKEVLDPALLRPGRMDMQIHLSYCKPQAFRTLASNYLLMKGEHPLYAEIDELLESLEVTPAAVAEELMRDEDGDAVLKGVVEFLKGKKAEKEARKEDEERVSSSASSDVSN